LDEKFKCAYICALKSAMPQPETNRNKVVARLERDGWIGRHGGGHDVYKHPARPGRIIVPRHRMLSLGVARAIAKVAGWRG
jgi:predicted RNA binding protein YcfA (HicA-like mRNA interferase family)